MNGRFFSGFSLTFTGVVKAHSSHAEPELAHCAKRVDTIPPSPFGKGEGRGNREIFTLTSVHSPRQRKQKRRAVKTAGVAGQSASG